MKKGGKTRSEASVPHLTSKSDIQFKEEIYVPPLDILVVKVLNLRLPDEPQRHFAIKITFFDQLLLTGIIKSIGARDVEKDGIVARGTMNYDPSDYEKMCLFADSPLVVHIQPLRSLETNVSGLISPRQSSGLSKSISGLRPIDISCCNVDILPLFLDLDGMCVKKRMQPMIKQSVLHRKSWENLPLLTMELSVVRNQANAYHHEILKEANYMKLTLVASYNMIVPYNEEYVYTAASKTPLHNETNTGLVTFNQGYKVSRRFNGTSLYPKWESLRLGDDIFTKGDEKLVYNIEDLQNEHEIDLKYYMTKAPTYNTTAWGSFHRTLMLDKSNLWLSKHLRSYKWPLEVHIYGEQGGYSFMAFLDLFRLLYPGETTVKLAVPLYWINVQTMFETCGCDLLLTPNDAIPSTPGSLQKPANKDSAPPSTSTDTGYVFRPTGADDNPAFVVVEVKLARSLKNAVIPPRISYSEIGDMLKDIEDDVIKRECTGRGQLNRDWLSTINTAVNSLRKVPHYGMTEFCNFYRQLSETRTRVELLTSFWQDAAIFINNNFVIHEFLQSDDTFEEMLMMAHACLMRLTCRQLVDVDNPLDMDPVLRAARHARQMQDLSHAMELYMQVIIQKPRDPNIWRELSTCLLDIDKDWSDVCLTKSLELDPRHPLTLLSMGCQVFEEDPEAAEIFFAALLSMFPLWSTGYVIANAYYSQRQLYHMADVIMSHTKREMEPGLVMDDPGYPRNWEYELGDWWDHTPLLPGMSLYYDAADLLLRLRAPLLAEVCLARALSEAGESAAYFHLVALCCRIRGDIADSLCHLGRGLEKFGEISYLRSLEAECLHKKMDLEGATTSFEKAGSCINPYSTLLSIPSRELQRSRSVLVDLIRRQPNAYAWMALADNWLTRAAVGEGGDAGATDDQASAKVCAIASAVQALKWDRRAGRAWALLAKLVAPSARRQYCKNMASSCGYEWTDERKESSTASKQSLCYRLGKALRECHCRFCSHLHF